VFKRIGAVAACTVTSALLFTATAQADESHTVEPGDTLSKISAAYGTTWQELYALNRTLISDPDLIFPGQVFVVRSDGKPASQTVLVSSTTVRPSTGPVTSNFGMRTHPITGVYKLHTGTDFAVGDGNAYAARAGTVVGSEWSGWGGNLVTIDHGDVETRYAHLSQRYVSDGDRVAAGTIVGLIGSTGMATGPHLHFEVISNGKYRDPLAWLG
jgi:murein DD-endopeptidase MepM/ murein hydrolase activator NlpD